MMYKGPGGYGRVMNIGMNLFMCAAFSFVMLWLAQQRVPEGVQVLTPVAYLISFITAFGIGYVVTDLIPVYHIGNGVANKLGLKGFANYFVTVLIIDLIVTTIIGFLMTMINMVERAGFPGALMAWITSYPLMLLVGLVVQLIIMKPLMNFAKNVTGFDPENPTPPGTPPRAGAPPTRPHP